MARLYRGFRTQEEIDAAYDTFRTARTGPEILQRWAERSRVARERLDCRAGVKYGPTRAEHLDIYPAGHDAPVHVFIHGGYWRKLSASDHGFVAPALVEAGATAVIVNYALCPDVSIGEIVRQVRAAIAWTHGNIAAFGGDPRRITVSGHSAGGHLAAMAFATPWEEDYGLPADLIRGGLSISGLFDLEPFRWSFLQPALQLTGDDIERYSPIRLDRSADAPFHLLVGGLESAEFQRQSRDFARWRDETHGAPSAVDVVENADHFTLLDGLDDPEGPLARALRELIAAA